MFYCFGLGGVQGEASEADLVEGFNHPDRQHRQLGAARAGGDSPSGGRGKFMLGLPGRANQALAGQQGLESPVEFDLGMISPSRL